MLEKICEDLNEYYSQFSTEVTKQPIKISAVKWNDVLINDSIDFFSDEDKERYNSAKRLLEKHYSDFAKLKNFEKSTIFIDTKDSLIKAMNTSISKCKFSSNKMFALTKDGNIVYPNKWLLNNSFISID